MNKSIVDLTGQKFGKLTVINQADPYISPSGYRKTRWCCECDCGNNVVVVASDLKRGHTQSCGCFQREMTGKALRRHGLRHTKIYHKWLDMKDRCLNKNNKRFFDYYGRGITVCDEWKNSFEAFYKWAMSHGYADNLSIDRIDVNGNYEPSNCRWITMSEQSRNKRNNVLYEYKGEIKTFSEWSRITGINYSTMLHRYHSGLTTEEIFFKGRLKNGIKNSETKVS